MNTYRSSGMPTVMAICEVCGVGMRTCHGERWEFMSWERAGFEDAVKYRARCEGRLSDERGFAVDGLSARQT
jgi:hypothetical protein